MVDWRAEYLRLLEFIEGAPVESGLCCCGDSMNHPFDSHSPRDQWDYAVECEREHYNLLIAKDKS